MPIIPVNAILKNSILMTWNARRDFIAMATIPVVILTLISAVFGYKNPNGLLTINDGGISINIDGMVASLIAFKVLFYIIFAAAWHRRCLMPSLSLNVATALKWDKGKTSFLFRIGGIVALILPLIIFIPAIGLILSFLIFSRLSLLLPAAAIGEDLTYKAAWKITKNNSWRMLWLSLAPSIAFSIITIITIIPMASFLANFNMGETLSGLAIIILLQEIIDYAGIAVGVAALSNAYKFFKKSNNNSL